MNMTSRVHRFGQVAWVIAFALPWLFAGTTFAEDWPQWRGPNRDAVWPETNVLQIFPTNGLKVRWQVPLGFGYSSPVVAEGRVFVSDSQVEKPKARDRVQCFDEVTGKVLWSFSNEVAFPEWAFTPGNKQGPNSTPLVRDGRVYVIGSLDSFFYCLDARTGHVLWQEHLVQKYFAESPNSSASPLIDGNLLVLVVGANSNACVVALDKISGKVIWKSLEDTAAHSSPVIIEARGTRQLVIWTRQSIASLDLATGKIYWRELFPGGDYNAVATPVFDGQRLLVGGLMLKLDASKPAATVLWPESRVAAKRTLSNTSTALLRDGLVFSAKSSGEFVCLDANTGQELWSTNSVTDQKNGASIHITVNGESVLLFNDRGELIRARLSAQSYREISRVKLIEPTYQYSGRKVVWTAPAFANGHVFARNERELISASLKTEP